MELGPLAPEMVRRILAWYSVDDLDASEEIARGALAVVNAGGTERQFGKWCDTVSSPWQLGRLDAKSRELLFLTISFEVYAYDQLGQMLSAANVLPMWRYWCSTTQICKPHASLDRFVARFDDPVWEIIYPPNCWACGCGVTPMLESDVKTEKAAKVTVDPLVLELCRVWLDEDPERVYDLL